jgi:penicillin amidase
LGRVVRKVVFGLFLLAFLLLLAGWGGTLWLRHAMRASLPQMDGQLAVVGLSAPVMVVRDAHGVPHITASGLDDLLLAQGYVTAQDRMWQMDMLRRFAAGDMAEVLGRGMLEHDRVQRILQIRASAEAALATLPAQDLHFLQDYANGVNAFLAASQDNLPAEFRLLHYRPRPWRPVDSLLIGMNMQQVLTTDFPAKLAREKIAAKLPPEMVADLYPVGSWRDHPPISTMPEITAPQQVPEVPLDASQASVQDILHLDALLHQPQGPDCRDCSPGSNNWVVSGAHSVTGLPLLSNDMHLDHAIPDPWYEAQLTSGGLDVAGVTLPGMPTSPGALQTCMRTCRTST